MLNKASGLALFLVAVLSAGTSLSAQSQQPLTVLDTSQQAEKARQPQVAIDKNGQIFIAFGQGNQLKCAVSNDQGRSFAVSTVGTGGVLSLGMRRGPRIVATDAGIVITAVAGEQGKGKDGDILAWRSTDNGASWSGPLKVNTVSGSAREGLHGMAALAHGRIFCSWLDLRSGKMEIYGASSADGGKSWNADRLVYRSPDGAVCTCCHPSVTFSPEGTLYVMWRNQLGGNRDMYFARSANGGATFTPARKLGRDHWAINICPMDGGAIAVTDADHVESVWMRAGSVFTARPESSEKLLGRGVQAWNTPSAAGVYNIWLEKRPGRLMLLPPGSKKPETLADEANDPVIVASHGSDGFVVAAWEAKSGKEGIIQCQVIRPAANK
ncbi:MAG: exo-alpha-sialidase [bacterium]